MFFACRFNVGLQKSRCPGHHEVETQSQSAAHPIHMALGTIPFQVAQAQMEGVVWENILPKGRPGVI